VSSITGGAHPDRLGIDFGSSNTVAMLRWPNGQIKPVLVDGAHLLASAVYADPLGTLLTGADAVRSASLAPERFEPNPKRRVDDGAVWLGDRAVQTVDLIAAVLGRVVREVRTTHGSLPPGVTITCPARWAVPRRRLLAEAASRAGLRGVHIVAEPVAAAGRLVEIGERDWPAGSAIVVYDLGGGTCDVSVIRLTAAGPEVLAVGGRDDIGGLDFDAAIVERARLLCEPRDPAAWQRLVRPVTTAERRSRRMLWEDARGAKEQLSRHPVAHLHVPGFETDLHVAREEFEALVRPLLEPTIEATAETIRRAGLDASQVAAVLLVGGSSRIPLVATLLHRRFGIAPIVMEQPETVVAEGATLDIGNPRRADVSRANGQAAAADATTEDDAWPEDEWEPAEFSSIPRAPAIRRVRWPVRSLWFAGGAQVLCVPAIIVLLRLRNLSAPVGYDLAAFVGSLCYLFLAGAGPIVMMAFNALGTRRLTGPIGTGLMLAAGLTSGTQWTLYSLGVLKASSSEVYLLLVAAVMGLIGAILTVAALRPLGGVGWLPAIGFVGSMLFAPAALLLPVGLGVALLPWLILRSARRADTEATEPPDEEPEDVDSADQLPSVAPLA
jgi:actin-like ATPase involved in cell morphogenesis